jgi:hypothetical protein
MNINTSEMEKRNFSIEDVVSYSNIEITHVNDNSPPMKVIVVRAVVWIVIVASVAALLLI